MIHFTVYAEPVAQGRPKFTTVNGHPRAYDPAKSSDYKQYVKLVASQHRPDALLDGPLMLRVEIYRSIPKSFSKKKQLEADQGVIRPITKPDSDNYLKAIKDALKGVFWVDDSQVVDVYVRKWYSDSPRIEIEVMEWDSD